MDLYEVARSIQDKHINQAWQRLKRSMQEVEDAERHIRHEPVFLIRLINRATAKVARSNARMVAKRLNKQLERAGRPERFDVGVI